MSCALPRWQHRSARPRGSLSSPNEKGSRSRRGGVRDASVTATCTQLASSVRTRVARCGPCLGPLVVT